MSFTNQSEPFIIHNIITPSSESSFVYSLILSYSKKLSAQNPHFLPLFKQKQQKLLRHNDQLKLLNEMKEDHMLREQVLEQIQLKDYQRQYQSLFGQSNSSFTDQRPLSHRLKQNSKQHRSFHFTNRQKKSKENSLQFNTHQKSSFAKEQQKKKFRSSIIKSGSFSSIKKKKSPFQNHTNVVEVNNRNSQDNTFSYSKSFKSNGQILKKKGVTQLGVGKKQPSYNFQKNNQIVKNEISEDDETNQQKQENQELQKFQDTNQVNEESSFESGRFSPEQTNTKRRSPKSVLGKFPSVSMKKHSPKKQKSGDLAKKELKYYMKENKENPYHISNFLRQINSYHYVSQYNQVKNQTKRNQQKKK